MNNRASNLHLHKSFSFGGSLVDNTSHDGRSEQKFSRKTTPKRSMAADVYLSQQDGHQ